MSSTVRFCCSVDAFLATIKLKSLFLQHVAAILCVFVPSVQRPIDEEQKRKETKQIYQEEND